VPGATSKSATNSCDGVNCTTTTTYYGPGGEVVQTTQDTKDQSSFCAENPGLQLCKNSAISASCSGFSCNGDAVQCAIAQQAFKTKCDWDAVNQSFVDAGSLAASGGNHPAGHPYNDGTTTSLSFSGAIDQTNLLGSGCPVDVSFTLAGVALALPFSQMCGPLQMVGQLAVGLCMLVAAFIVFRQ